MAVLGSLIIYIIMICTMLGAIAAIRDPEKGLGKEFITGLHSIGGAADGAGKRHRHVSSSRCYAC